jgi:ATP-dependent DNA ligase
MPLLHRKARPEPPPDPEDWRPQRFGHGSGRSMRDAIIEPSWSGVRVLARFDGSLTRLTDQEGVDCTTEFASVAQAITAAALAGEFVLDGFLTVEPTQVATGDPVGPVGAPTSGQMMAQMIGGSYVAQLMEPESRPDPDRPVAFVAVDLLAVDGSRLLDVPLLERKRLLESSIKPGELVRITPFVRPPIGSYVATWRGAGFDGLAYKGANSRYMPDARNDDWSIMSMPMK